MRLLPITLLLVSTASAQTYDAKAIYQKLPTAQPSPELYQEAVSASIQITNLPKSYVQDLIPFLFAAIKSDTDGKKGSAMGLRSLSRRPDSGDLLKPYMKDIVALFASPNPVYKDMAGIVFLNMNPQPPEAADALLGFINGPTGTIIEKINALTSLTRLQNPPKDKTEAAATYVLKQPMPGLDVLGAAINASIYPGASDKMVDKIAQYLTHPDWSVQMRAIFALRCFGPQGAVGRYRGQLIKMANDSAEPNAIRQFAQDTLDNKDEKCFEIQWNPPKLNPIPGCK